MLLFRVKPMFAIFVNKQYKGEQSKEAHAGYAWRARTGALQRWTNRWGRNRVMPNTGIDIFTQLYLTISVNVLKIPY